MATNLDRYKADLARLVKLGKQMLADLHLRSVAGLGRLTKEQEETAPKLNGRFEAEYQRWYSESLAVVRQLLPARLGEFESLYKGDGRRKRVDALTYTIQDWLLGARAVPDLWRGKPFDDLATVVMRLKAQAEILASVEGRFESSLFEIRQLVQADVFDSELDAARELLKSGFLRAGGAVAGVVLEKHLQEVCGGHGITVRKKDPTIGDLNDALKGSTVIDVPVWRQIQRLGDLRNLCSHQKQREPTRDEVAELIDGCSRVAKSVY
jgi:hypothetical protein